MGLDYNAVYRRSMCISLSWLTVGPLCLLRNTHSSQNIDDEDVNDKDDVNNDNDNNNNNNNNYNNKMQW